MNGLLIQWGRYVGLIGDDKRVSISFPMAFGTMGTVMISAFDTAEDDISNSELEDSYLTLCLVIITE